MKKLLCITLAALLLLCGCAKTETVPHTNIVLNFGAFSMGDTVMETTPHGLLRYHADAQTVLDHFCYDPLCDHSGNDGVCPDCYNLEFSAYATDGVRIYANGRSFLSALNGGTWNRDEHWIVSMNIDGSDMKRLLSYNSTNAAEPFIHVRDGWLYFYQSFYEDEYDPALKGNQDQYVKIMRLNLQNGKTEEGYTEKLVPEDRFYLDEQHYYILHMDDGFSISGSTLDVIDRATGDAVLTDLVPDGCPVIYVTEYENQTYFVCLETNETVQYANAIVLQSYAVFRFDGESCEKLVGGIGNLTGIVFADGAVWYEPYTFTYFGAKDMPTGNGSETAPCDFYSCTDGSIVRYDLSDSSVRMWHLPTADDGDCADFLGMSDGVAIVRVDNPEKDFTGETYTSGVYKFRLSEDGTMTEIGKFEVRT